MVTSNEPGVYKAGSHGIRTENLVLTVKDGEGMFGELPEVRNHYPLPHLQERYHQRDADGRGNGMAEQLSPACIRDTFAKPERRRTGMAEGSMQ